MRENREDAHEDDDDDDDVFMTAPAPRIRATREMTRATGASVGDDVRRNASSANAPQEGRERAQKGDTRAEQLLDAISAYEHASEALTNAEWETFERERERRRERAASRAMESAARIDRLCGASATKFLACDVAPSPYSGDDLVSSVAVSLSEDSDEEDVAAPADVVRRARRSYERRRALEKACASEITVERIDASLEATERALEAIRENDESRVEAKDDSIRALDEALRACRRVS
jgi:hypothetical protein